jgi:hypothetical protein
LRREASPKVSNEAITHPSIYVSGSINHTHHYSI